MARGHSPSICRTEVVAFVPSPTRGWASRAGWGGCTLRAWNRRRQTRKWLPWPEGPRRAVSCPPPDRSAHARSADPQRPRHRRQRQSRLPRHRGRGGRRAAHLPRRYQRPVRGACHRRRRPRRGAGVHRHAFTRRADDPARAASRTEGAPGRHHRAHRHRRQLARAVQDARRPASLHRAGLRAQRRATDAGGLAHGRRAAVDVRQQGRRQHLLHPRQLPRAHLGGGLGRSPGHASRARRDEVGGPRGLRGGIVRPVHRPGLSAWIVRRHQRADRAVQGRGARRRLLSHAHPRAPAAEGAPRALARGPRDRPRQRHPRSLHALSPAVAGRRLAPGLPGPRRAQPGRGARRHLRLLSLRLRQHPRQHLAAGVDDGRRSGAAGGDPGCAEGPRPPPAGDAGQECPGPHRRGMADQLPEARERGLRRAIAARHLSRARPGSAGHLPRSHAERGPQPLRGHDRHQSPDPARVRVAPLRHGRQRRHPARGVSQSPDLRLLPGDPRGVRPRGEAPAIARGDPEDDLVSRPAARPARSRATPGRHEGRHRHLRPQPP